ncbi:hypothetical protein [Chengkuizengella sediminis]|uniref:hypothetical protein n=1 Tax=Chengkuizengella sediminis TaxID=1885917 RepID=UPI00138A6B18|nr:hypothetical protein [Chengkuizengella sediminis]NDI35384.1 hypothetical protein [Chengkuizengella sediminis]
MSRNKTDRCAYIQALGDDVRIVTGDKVIEVPKNTVMSHPFSTNFHVEGDAVLHTFFGSIHLRGEEDQK